MLVASYNRIGINTWLSRFIIGVATFAVLPLSEATAFSISPMVEVLKPTGSGARMSYLVDNIKGSSSVAVEAQPFLLTFDEKGNEVLQPADDDLLVFPPVAKIGPGESQVLQVQYVGEPVLQSSKAYRIVVEELPVVAAEGGQSMGFFTKFSTLLNVSPDGATPQLQVIEVTPIGDGGYELTLQNKGNRFARLSKTSWRIRTADRGETVVAGATLGAMLNENLILPQSTRTVIFTPPTDLGIGEPSSIEIDAGS